MKPKFSIITCTKNSGSYLKYNIDSVIGQTFGDFEHIFIDGESDDQTIGIIKKYQLELPEKVSLTICPPKGIANAMNEGIKKAKGDYVICLHSDDLFYDSNVLKESACFLGKNQPDWIYSKEMQIDSFSKELRLFINYKIFRLGGKYYFSRYLLKYFNFIRHQSVFIKKDVFDKFGYFNESFAIAMDYEYWLRIKNSTNWIFFDRIVSRFRNHDSGMSSSPLTKTKTYLEEMRAGRLYMNWFEFYILRFLFKIIVKTIVEIKKQIQLYLSFYKIGCNKKSL